MAKKVKTFEIRTTELRKLRKWQLFVVPYNTLCTVVDDSDKENIVVRKLAEHLAGGEWFGNHRTRDITLPGSTIVQVGDFGVAGTKKGEIEISEGSLTPDSMLKTDDWQKLLN